MRSILPVLLLAFMVFSCRDDRRDARLEDIREFVSDFPEVAMDSLAKIDVTKLSADNRHLYDLLSIKAKDKADIKHTSDSLVIDVIRYYENYPDSSLKSEALYYGGRVYRDLGEYSLALGYFQKALETLPKKEKLTQSESRIHSQTSGLLNDMRLYTEAVPYAERAIEINRHNNDTTYWVYNLFELGSIHMRAQNYKLADQYFTQVLPLVENQPKELIDDAKVYLAMAKSLEGWHNIAVELIWPIVTDTVYEKNYFYKGYAAGIFYAARLYDLAYIYAKEVNESGYELNKTKMLEILLSPELADRHDRNTLVEYTRTYANLITQQFNENDFRMASDKQNMYNYKRHEIEKEKAQASNKRLKIWIVVLCYVFLIVLVFILFYKNRNKKMADELRNLIEAVEALRTKETVTDDLPAVEADDTDTDTETGAETADTDTETADNDIAENYTDSFNRSWQQNETPEKIKEMRRDLSNRLLALYYENPNVGPSEKIVNSGIKKELLALIEANRLLEGKNYEVWSKVEKIILDDNPKFKKDIYLLTDGKLSREEYHTVLLIKVGLSPSQIGKLIGRAKNTISTRRDNIGKRFFDKKIASKIVDALIHLI